MYAVRKFAGRKFMMLSLAGLALLLSGCATTWVEKSADWEPKKPTEALLCYYNVQSNGGVDVIDLGKQAAGGQAFDDVGMRTYKLMTKSLEKFNLSVSADRNRAKKLDSIAKEYKDLDTGSSGANRLLGSLTSQWRHPGSSDAPFHRYSNLNPKMAQDLVGKVRGKNKEEVFLSGELKIEDQDQFLVFKRYRLILSLKALDYKGNVVFQSRAEGFTNLTFLRNPWSEERIETAMAKALEKMTNVEAKKEISTFNNL